MKNINIAPVQQFLSKEVSPTEMAVTLDTAIINLIGFYSAQDYNISDKAYTDIVDLHRLRNVLLLADGNQTFYDPEVDG